MESLYPRGGIGIKFALQLADAVLAAGNELVAPWQRVVEPRKYVLYLGSGYAYGCGSGAGGAGKEYCR